VKFFTLHPISLSDIRRGALMKALRGLGWLRRTPMTVPPPRGRAPA
jgi:hypothetical protein